MKGALIRFGVLASVLVLLVGCSHQDPTTVSSSDTSSTDSNNVKTVKTFVEIELTTTKEEKEAFKNFYSDKAIFSEGATALNQFLEKHYKPLLPEKDFETFVNTNKGLLDLLPAYLAGYDLKPTHIEIQKVDSENVAYTFKAEVACSKDGQTNTSTVTGYINLNAKGKISAIQEFNDKELQNIFRAHTVKEKAS